MEWRIELSSAGKSFADARANMKRAKDDPNDAMTHNVAEALDDYFSAVGAAQAEIVRGLNDLFARVDRIQTKLGMP